MTAETARPAKHRIDPLLPAVGLVSLLVFIPHGFHGYLSRDLGLYSYAGQSVYAGDPPYVGLLNRAGPLAHVVPAIGVAGARLFGIDDVVGMRILFMLLSVLMVCLTYVLVRDIFGSRLVGLVGAGTTLCLQGIIEYATGGPREKTTMAICLLVALIATLHRRWWAVGAGISLATLTWQPVFTLGLGATLAAILLLERGWRSRGAAVLKFGVGGAIPLLAFVIYYAAVGHLKDFYDAFFLINLQYTQQVSFSEDPSKVWRDVVLGFGATRYVVIIGLIALVVATVVSAVKVWRSRSMGVTPAQGLPGRDLALTVMGIGAMAGIVWSYRVFNGWADALFLVPFSSIGWAWLATLAHDHLPERAGRPIVVGVAAASVVWGLFTSIDTRESLMDEQQASTRAVMDQLPDDATVWSIQAPQPLVFLHQENPSRHQMFRNGLQDYVDDTYPGGLPGFVDQIIEERPEVISVYDFVPQWLSPQLNQHYTYVGKAPGWMWFVSNDVGEDTIRRIEEAVDGV